MTSPRYETLDRFYPILPDADWVARLVPLGIGTVQLRAKDIAASEVGLQIERSLHVCDANGCRLIVNDFWREAIAAGAHWVHLGQEDLAAADVGAIKRAGLKLGISTHDDAELDIALAADPDYIALGPVYETKLKAMTWAPQGLDRVRAWKDRIGTRPLVAIGGITPERADGVLAAGADSCAVITDFMAHADPVGRVRAWVSWSRSPRD